MTPDEAFEVLAAISHPGVLRLQALDTIRALIDREKRREAEPGTDGGPPDDYEKGLL